MTLAGPDADGDARRRRPGRTAGASPIPGGAAKGHDVFGEGDGDRRVKVEAEGRRLAEGAQLGLGPEALPQGLKRGRP